MKTDILQNHVECYCGERFDFKSESFSETENYRFSELEKFEIRDEVCQDLPLKEFEGKQYCVLHYPSKNKIEEFNRVFQKRLESKEYDFRGVWFPQKVELSKYNFEHAVNFEKAVFSDEVDFSSVTFSKDAKYSSAIFCAEATFHSSVFFVEANFNSAVFSEKADFSKTAFSSNANFYEVKFEFGYFSRSSFSVYTNFQYAEFESAFFDQAKFSGRVFFDFAVFSKGFSFASFQWATFEENSHPTFIGTTFNFAVMFNLAIFKGYVYFQGEIKDKKGSINCFEQDSSLALENARVEKPERIFFHSVRLCPHWFINVDPRKFVFINITWENKDKLMRHAIKAELEKLKDKFSPHLLLTVTYRQLAVNAEENSRYEEASYFRRMAFETEWLGKKERLWNWVS